MKMVRLISRILLGFIFVFSGFIKGQDPMGFMFKIQDYFIAYGWDWAMPFALSLVVILCTLEFTIGMALLLNFKPLLTAWGLLLTMSGFLILTFFSALYNPVPDCGCFGDAIPLTNWQTFINNVILMIPTLIIFFTTRSAAPSWTKRSQLTGLLAVVLIFAGFTVYSYNRLPFFDFMDWKTGTDVTPENAGQPITYLIYRNVQTGETVELLSKDLPWQDSVWMSQWEFADMRIDDSMVRKAHQLLIYDSAGADVTGNFIDHSQHQFLLVSYDLSIANKHALRKMNDFYRKASDEGHSFIMITGSLITEAEPIIKKYELPYEVYNADDITLKTMVRSNPGLILLKDGLILQKWHFHCFPGYEEVAMEYFREEEPVPSSGSPE